MVMIRICTQRLGIRRPIKLFLREWVQNGSSFATERTTSIGDMKYANRHGRCSSRKPTVSEL
jgi:hypothetical protein